MFDQLRKLTKVPTFRRCDISVVVEEVEGLQDLLTQGCLQNLSRYNTHRVHVDGQAYVAADARSLNRCAGSRGRGNWRYLFNGAFFAGVAEHTPQNKYRMVCSYVS